jgi:hypothetical protein
MMRGRFKRDERNGGTSTEEAPLFNLDEIYEQRILSWSPEPEDELAAAEAKPPDEEAPAKVEPPARKPKPVAVEPEALRPAAPVERPAAPIERPAATRVEAAPAARVGAVPAVVSTPVEPAAVEAVAEPPAVRREAPPAESADDSPRRRGRPRGRPRRQVHFHVDPDEERLLMRAVEMYGSQQKALVAALTALEQAAHFRARIEELERESERQRVLLAQAESLFTRD